MAYAGSLPFSWAPTFGGLTPFRLPPWGAPLLRALPYGLAAYLLYRIWLEYNAKQDEGVGFIPGNWEVHENCGGNDVLGYRWNLSYWLQACQDLLPAPNKSTPPSRTDPSVSSYVEIGPSKVYPGNYRALRTWRRIAGRPNTSAREYVPPTYFPDLKAIPDPKELKTLLDRVLPVVWPQLAPGYTAVPQSRAIPWMAVPALAKVDLAGGVVRGNVIPRRDTSPGIMVLPDRYVDGKKIEYPAWVEAWRTVATPGQKPVSEPVRHELKPPERKTKERKLRTKSGRIASAIWHAVNGVTEACDFVDALYNALPKITRAQYDKKLAAKGNYQNWRRFQSRKMVDGLNTDKQAPMKSNNVYDWTSGFQACMWKARIVYKELDLINMDQAIINIARETLTDFAIGKLMRGTNPVSQQIGRGVQLGGWDNPHFNING